MNICISPSNTEIIEKQWEFFKKHIQVTFLCKIFSIPVTHTHALTHTHGVVAPHER
jgi:hypothetical protein